jgi:hypothetical protein
MNSIFLRVAALLLHAVANFVLVNYLVNFDIAGKWVYFIGFIVLLLILIYFFIRHIVSFVYFIKTKTK